MIESMAWILDSIRRDNIQTEERVTDLQYRSMKMNLIITGLDGESRNETTECKLREFLENELDIKQAIYCYLQRAANKPLGANPSWKLEINNVNHGVINHWVSQA